MKIYKLYMEPKKYSFVKPIEDEDVYSLWNIDDYKKINHKFKIETLNDVGENLPISDISNLGTNFPFCFNDKVLNTITKPLQECGVIKEVVFDERNGASYLFWPSNVIDCLDEEKSEISTTATGFKSLVKPVFHMDKIPKESIFIVPQFMVSDLFVTEDIAEILKASDLTGYILVNASIPRN